MSVCLVHSNEPKLHYLLDMLTIPHTTGTPDTGEYDVVIQWGAFHQDRPAQRLLQPVQHVLRSLNPRKTASLLGLHGIRAVLESDADTDSYPYLFCVPVFHLEPLTVFQKKRDIFYLSKAAVRQPRKFVEIGTAATGFHVGRAMREAVKAIYALGLDYGVVTMGIQNAKSPVEVLRIEAVPVLDERLGKLFADAIHRYSQGLEREQSLRQRPVTLGMDPEFLLRDPFGQVVFASEYMNEEGRVGCDSIVLPDLQKIFPLAELRPNPSPNIRQLIINLRRSMQLAALKIGDPHLEWLAGGMPVQGFPLGGHIHFSSVWLNSHLLRSLDNYLALPLVLIEDETTRNRRPKYGFLGDFRRKSHGGFEYRTLPSWIISPTVAKGVLALAKLISSHYLELCRQPLQSADVQEAYYRGDKAKLRAFADYLWQDIAALSSYRSYEKYIAPLKELVMSGQSWDEQADFRKKWKISPFSDIKAVQSIKS
jgi:hypothetical protein